MIQGLHKYGTGIYVVFIGFISRQKSPESLEME